jgi:hypothetical protein
VALVAASFGRPPSPALAADDVVGSGAPASCTEAAFNTVLSTVQGSGGGTITFNCGAAAHTITFTTEKSITAGVTVNGAGLIRLSGNNATRLFNVQTGATLTLAGLTLTAGSAGEGGAILNNGRLVISDSQLIANRATSSFGGAISSYGPATLTGTDVISNVAPNIGGGIYNQSQLTINGGRISGNSTTGGTAPGGGLYSGIGTAITLTNASLINNIAADGGGGLYALSAATTLANTIVSGNSARFGGGISQFGSTLTLTDVVLADNGWVINPQGFANEGGGLHLRQTTARLERVTLSNNAGQFGGGVWAQGSDVRLLNTTVSGNRSTNTGAGLYATGGGVHLAQVTVANNLIDTPSTLTGAGVFVELGSSLVLTSTLLSGNRLTRTQASANCGGAAPTASASLSSDGSCALGTGRDNVALPLGPLQNNGGFTPTHLLPQGSPAIDAGSNSGCPAVDQRGQARPVGATCDVGAIEARASDFIQQVFLPTLQK